MQIWRGFNVTNHIFQFFILILCHSLFLFLPFCNIWTQKYGNNELLSCKYFTFHQENLIFCRLSVLSVLPMICMLWSLQRKPSFVEKIIFILPELNKQKIILHSLSHCSGLASRKKGPFWSARKYSAASFQREIWLMTCHSQTNKNICADRRGQSSRCRAQQKAIDLEPFNPWLWSCKIKKKRRERVRERRETRESVFLTSTLTGRINSKKRLQSGRLCRRPGCSDADVGFTTAQTYHQCGLRVYVCASERTKFASLIFACTRAWNN